MIHLYFTNCNSAKCTKIRMILYEIYRIDSYKETCYYDGTVSNGAIKYLKIKYN